MGSSQQRWIYFTTITIDNDLLFTALKTPELTTLE
jgi:hypothetical protein